MSGPPTTKAPSSRATGSRSLGDRGTGDRGTGDRGTAQRRGTDRRGTDGKDTPGRGIPPAPPPARYLVAPDEVTFPDVVVGDVAKLPLWIFNVHPSSSVNLHVEVEVARDRPSDLPPFQIESAPARLRPSREGTSEPVVIAFTSQRRAEYTGKLVAVASSGYPAMDTQRIEVRLRGWTREAGEPLRADVLAAEAAREAADRAAREKAARLATMQRRYDQESDAPYPQSKENELDRQVGRAGVELNRLCAAQFAAVTVVKDEAEKFKRRPPPPSHSFAKALASFAFDVATAGIAARVAAGVVKAFSDRVKYVRPDPVGELWNIQDRWRYVSFPAEGPPKRVPIPDLLSPEGMHALDEMVQATVSGTLGQLESRIALKSPTDREPGTPAPRGAGDGPVSSVPELEFFYQQSQSVADEKAKRGTSLVDLHALLKPSLRREADAAITAMRALAESIESEIKHAGSIQASQTRQAWMSFLSQSSVGSLTATELRRSGLRVLDDTVTVTDAKRMAHATSGGKPTAYDGVLDVYVRANRHRPLEPVTIERMHMNGVIPEMLRRCVLTGGLAAGRKLARFGDLRVALRIIAIASGIEDFGVVVTRDEAGNVFSSDTTGALPQDSTWLARRAGHDRTSPALQQEGAVHVMNEILRKDTVPEAGLSTDAA